MIVQKSIGRQGILPAGTNVLIAGTAGYSSTISYMRFYNSSANDISVTVNKVIPETNSVVSYAFTLAAGDVLVDNNTYVIFNNESLEVTTTSADTHYSFSGLLNSVQSGV